jgi:hypothetical protein
VRITDLKPKNWIYNRIAENGGFIMKKFIVLIKGVKIIISEGFCQDNPEIVIDKWLGEVKAK